MALAGSALSLHADAGTPEEPAVHRPCPVSPPHVPARPAGAEQSRPGGDTLRAAAGQPGHAGEAGTGAVLCPASWGPPLGAAAERCCLWGPYSGLVSGTNLANCLASTFPLVPSPCSAGPVCFLLPAIRPAAQRQQRGQDVQAAAGERGRWGAGRACSGLAGLGLGQMNAGHDQGIDRAVSRITSPA